MAIDGALAAISGSHERRALIFSRMRMPPCHVGRELDREVSADDVDQRPRALEQRTRARDLVAHGADRGRRAARRDVSLADAEATGISAGR